MKVWVVWVWMADGMFDIDEIYATREKAVAAALRFIASLGGIRVRHYGSEELNRNDDIQCWTFDDTYGKDNRVFAEEKQVVD